MATVLDIVIPTYQAAADIGRTLTSLKGALRPGDEIIVADGGSDDATVANAAAAGARVIQSPRGRGTQLAIGADAGDGDWLLFLHADTRLAPGWREVCERFADDPANGRRAGYFRLALDDASAPARRIERLAAWRARVPGLPYGDQGLLLSRRRYDSVGGYRPLVLMEDVDIVRRLGRVSLVELPAAATTSAARYHRDGWWLRPLRNLTCLALYLLGLPPRWIARIYC